MALASSGTLSIGGSTANRSINLELGRSATATSSLGESALRTLAGVSSGAISISDFYGASNAVDVQTITAAISGTYGSSFYFQGYRTGSYGSISDGTFNGRSGATITDFYSSHVYTTDRLFFKISGVYSNAGFTTLNLNGVNYSRSSATFTTGSNYSQWMWDSVGGNPFGLTSGTVSRTATFT
jgi:hypothetical protein